VEAAGEREREKAKIKRKRKVQQEETVCGKGSKRNANQKGMQKSAASAQMTWRENSSVKERKRKYLLGGKLQGKKE